MEGPQVETRRYKRYVLIYLYFTDNFCAYEELKKGNEKAIGWTQNLKNPFDGTNFDAGNVALALYAGLFSYDGWDILNFGAEEIEKPRR
uniref:Uncharacterized protein n=1 Tax=Parascaris equorum TaxID=6256 RepID=A0A914RX87_PAREQ